MLIFVLCRLTPTLARTSVHTRCQLSSKPCKRQHVSNRVCSPQLGNNIYSDTYLVESTNCTPVHEWPWTGDPQLVEHSVRPVAVPEQDSRHENMPQRQHRPGAVAPTLTLQTGRRTRAAESMFLQRRKEGIPCLPQWALHRAPCTVGGVSCPRVT